MVGLRELLTAGGDFRGLNGGVLVGSLAICMLVRLKHALGATGIHV